MSPDVSGGVSFRILPGWAHMSLNLLGSPEPIKTRGFHGPATLWGLPRAPIGFFLVPGSFLAGYSMISVIFGRISWGPGLPNFVVFTILGRCEGFQGLP